MEVKASQTPDGVVETAYTLGEIPVLTMWQETGSQSSENGSPV
jgi:hypothetical protein